jgi:hypothetical protein
MEEILERNAQPAIVNVQQIVTATVRTLQAPLGAEHTVLQATRRSMQ